MDTNRVYQTSARGEGKTLKTLKLLVREGGLEPPRGIAPPDPKSGASTNSATPAAAFLIVIEEKNSSRDKETKKGPAVKGRPAGGLPFTFLL